jgi:sugar phosphate isomerase/epimerase
VEEGKSLTESVAEFADVGFEAMSFLPQQITALSQGEADEMRALMRDRDLAATVHGNCDLTGDEIETVVSALGGQLRTFTLDPMLRRESLGDLYDAPKTAGVLSNIERCTRNTDVRFAVEDFPLDEVAADFYRDVMSAVWTNPRAGVLIDVGHLNVRLRRDAYFRGLSPATYLSRVPLPIIEIHVHDNAGQNDTHSPLGAGNAPFEAVAAGLKTVGFDGIATIEVAPPPYTSDPSNAKAVAKGSLEQWRTIWCA